MKQLSKEELKALGLDDETIDKILTAHNAAVQAIQGKLTTAQATITQLQGDITKRDADIKALKDAAGDDDIKTQLTDLQTKYAADKADYAKTLAAIKEVAAIAHDPDLIVGLLDKGKIELGEDGKVKGGIKDQIDSLKKEKAFLFKEEGAGTQKFKGIRPGQSKDDPPADDDADKQAAEFAKGLAQEVKSETAARAETHYFG